MTRLRYPATARNRDPILEVLRRVLPEKGLVLELASGSGEHVTHFARHLPGLTFQPTDPEAEARQSVAAWAVELGVTNVLPPLALDASAERWPVERADAVVCINMIHISPWPATLGLLRGASRVLPAGSPLYLYGPFRQAGVPFAPSNEDFDRSLKERDPAWGVRDLDEVTRAAGDRGLALGEVVSMPANNLSVIFRKA